MPKLTLIRHGQANSTAMDEARYDRLSPLGHQQSRWLGDCFAQTETQFDRLYCGTLRRHIETLNGILPHSGELQVQDSRLNEMAYFTLSQLLYEQQGVVAPNSSDGFSHHLPQLFEAWANNEIYNAPESFANFEARVNAALDDLTSHESSALVVTSGGVISMIMRLTMGLDLATTARACLAIMNSSVHCWRSISNTLTMTQFNNVAHLEHSDRRAAQTYI